MDYKESLAVAFAQEWLHAYISDKNETVVSIEQNRDEILCRMLKQYQYALSMFHDKTD